MCLILFSLGEHRRYPVIIAANRDEAYRRNTASLGFWVHAPHVAGGRDLEAGGTWLGMTRSGRWAALTNYRQAGSYRASAPSRGRLVSDYLEGAFDPERYVHDIAASASLYNGFNLVVGEGVRAYYLSNRADAPLPIAPGIHGLSNHLLDTPWPKVTHGKRALAALPEAPIEGIQDALFSALAARTVAPDADLPDTGVGIPGERILSPPFIAAESYGTRASTVILVDRQGTVTILEREFGPMGRPAGDTGLTFTLEALDAAALAADSG